MICAVPTGRCVLRRSLRTVGEVDGRAAAHRDRPAHDQRSADMTYDDTKRPLDADRTLEPDDRYDRTAGDGTAPENEEGGKEAMGAGAGALGGAAVGMAVGGPPGAVVGGAVGAVGGAVAGEASEGDDEAGAGAGGGAGGLAGAAVGGAVAGPPGAVVGGAVGAAGGAGAGDQAEEEAEESDPHTSTDEPRY